VPQYRATLRYGGSRHQYHVVDVRADSLSAAIRAVADQVPAEADATADLVEIRRQADPDAREYTPE